MNKCTMLIIDVPFPQNLHELDGTALAKVLLHVCLPRTKGSNEIAPPYKNSLKHTFSLIAVFLFYCPPQEVLMLLMVMLIANVPLEY